jgi:hypothetical protein
MSTIERGPGGIQQFSAAGQLRMAMRAGYDSVDK